MRRTIVSTFPKWSQKTPKGKKQSRRIYVIFDCFHGKVLRRRMRRGFGICEFCIGGTLPANEWKQQAPHVHPRHRRVA